MAILSTIICKSCHKEKKVTHSGASPTPATCDECKEQARREEKKAYLAELKKLPIERRLERLEEEMYDNKHGRLKHRYQPPRPIG